MEYEEAKQKIVDGLQKKQKSKSFEDNIKQIQLSKQLTDQRRKACIVKLGRKMI